MWKRLFHYYCPQFRKLPSIPEKWQSPKKWPILTPKKVNVRPEEKSHSPNPYWHPLFAKNGVQIGQILPLWAHLYFTSSYRGSPPCTLSQHPDNRETWYSNVLGGGGLNFCLQIWNWDMIGRLSYSLSSTCNVTQMSSSIQSDFLFMGNFEEHWMVTSHS